MNMPSRYAVIPPRRTPRKANRYSGACDRCKDAVDAEKGVLIRKGETWAVRCRTCYVTSGLHRIDREGNRNYRRSQQAREEQRRIARVTRYIEQIMANE